MTDKKKQFEDVLKRVPSNPGVYLYKDAKDKVIYIGKAKALNKRVRSYFNKNHPDAKTRHLVANIEKIDYIVVDSEAEAFILEANLIRRYKPRYNIDLKSNHFPYLKITNEKFPRILVVRRKIHDGAEYFGPYPQPRSMRRVLDSLNQHFLLRQCSDADPTKRERPCLHRDIGRCIAPCSGDVSQEDYKELLANVRLFLKGKRTELLELLQKSMELESANMEFERAARYRDAIESVEDVLRPQKIDQGLRNRVIIVAAISKNLATFSVFRIREGAILNHHRFTANAAHESTLKTLMSEFLGQLYTKLAGDIPPEILMQRMPENPDELSDFLADLAGHKVQLMTPKRGNPLGLIKLARQNARLALSEAMAQKLKHHIPFAIHALQKELGLSRLPLHIEAFDISNIGENARVGGMVFFRDGKPRRSLYRNFLIKTVEGQDDPACMKEVVGRRISRLIREEKELPDLILIDGGKTQLNAAIQALQENDALDKLDLISIAKRLEEIHVPQFPEPISLAKDSAAIKLLQRIRDEVHDQAITYHRKVRARNSFKSVLEELPGIGPKRRDKLLRSYKSIGEIKKDTSIGIKEKTGMSEKLAEKLLSFLKVGNVVVLLFAVLFSACASFPRYYSDSFKHGQYNPRSESIKKAESKTEKPIAQAKIEEKPKDTIIPPDINNDYISPVEGEPKTTAKAKPKGRKSRVSSGNSRQQNIMGSVNYYLGTPYNYGGESAFGMDCSGLTMTVYKEALDISLPRTVSQQIERGQQVAQSSRRFGDLMFFKMEHSSPDHVGIYLGDDNFVHASESRGVTISSLSKYYQKRLHSVRRLD